MFPQLGVDDIFSRPINFQGRTNGRRILRVTHVDRHDAVSVIGSDDASLRRDDLRGTMKVCLVDFCSEPVLKPSTNFVEPDRSAYRTDPSRLMASLLSFSASASGTTVPSRSVHFCVKISATLFSRSSFSPMLDPASQRSRNSMYAAATHGSTLAARSTLANFTQRYFCDAIDALI